MKNYLLNMLGYCLAVIVLFIVLEIATDLFKLEYREIIYMLVGYTLGMFQGVYK